MRLKAVLLEEEKAQREKALRNSVTSKICPQSDVLTMEPETTLVNLSQGFSQLKCYFYYLPNYPPH